MNVDAVAAAMVRAATKPPKPQKREQLRCICCGLIVGETIQFSDGLERYVKTTKGPVCGACLADPHAKERAERGNIRYERGVTFRAQIRRGLTGAEREERDAEIVRMHDAGATYTEIAPLVGMSKQGAATAARRVREGG